MTGCRRACSTRIGWPKPTPKGNHAPVSLNGYYPEEQAPDVDEDRYKLVLDGLVDNKQSWTLDQLYALPQETQITRLVCVEGWSAIGKWSGAPPSDFLRRIGADLTAKYVHFVCAEGYSTSIDMRTALHAQTQMTFKYDGEILPVKYGFPMRIRIPTKLGFKNPKFVGLDLAVINNYPADIGKTGATTGSAAAERAKRAGAFVAASRSVRSGVSFCHHLVECNSDLGDRWHQTRK